MLTASFNVDQELVLAGPCGVPRDGEGVFSGTEMKLMKRPRWTWTNGCGPSKSHPVKGCWLLGRRLAVVLLAELAGV